MTLQLVLITVLVVVSTVSLVINFGLWSDLKQAQADLADTEAAATFYERAADDYLWETSRLESAYNDCVHIIREMQQDLAFAQQDNTALKDQVESLEDLLAAIHAASPITADIWYEDAEDRPLPF